MQEIYHAAYERDGRQWRTVHEPSVCAPAAAPLLPGEAWLGCGSGFLAYRDLLESRYTGQLEAVEPERYPHARDVAELALPRFAARDVMSAENAAPVYLRDKVALRTDERSSR
jgi:tRNA threonylcarbamoyladenosine biosynthesis protein TsaB